MIILEEQSGGLNAGLNKFRLFKKKEGGTKFGNLIRKNVNLKNTIKATALVASFVPVVGGVASKGIGIISKLASSKIGATALNMLKSPIGKMVVDKVKEGVGLTPQENAVATQIVVAQDTDPNTPNVLPPAEFNALTNGTIAQAPMPVVAQPAPAPAPMPAPVKMQNATPTPAQVQTIAQIKGVPAQELSYPAEEEAPAPNDAQLETISQIKDIPAQTLKEEVVAQKEAAKAEAVAPVVPPATPAKTNYTIPIVVGVGVLGAVALIATSSSSKQN